MEKSGYLRAYYQGPARAEDDGSGPLKFTASTEGVGRDGLIIKASAWELDNYRNNPVVLWVHDYRGNTLPIGRAEVEVADKTLDAIVEFDGDDEFAQRVESKYRRRFLNAVSVGWNTLEMEIIEDTPVISKAELLDISAVPVPGDADALIQRQHRGLAQLGVIDLAAIKPIAADARSGAVLNKRNREALEEARKLIGEVLRSAEKSEEKSDDEAEARAQALLADLQQIGQRIGALAGVE